MPNNIEDLKLAVRALSDVAASVRLIAEQYAAGEIADEDMADPESGEKEVADARTKKDTTADNPLSDKDRLDALADHVDAKVANGTKQFKMVRVTQGYEFNHYADERRMKFKTVENTKWVADKELGYNQASDDGVAAVVCWIPEDCLVDLDIGKTNSALGGTLVPSSADKLKIKATVKAGEYDLVELFKP